MELEIIDVEHGACALITTSNGKRIMIDAGHNATTGWRPGDACNKADIYDIDRLIVTNYDEDHVSGLPNLMEKVHVKSISRNWRVAPQIIRQLKTEDGMGRGIECLVETLEHTFTGGIPAANDLDFGDVSLEFFANGYANPPSGFVDENNLSLVTFVSCGPHRIVFPGDMERDGWRALLSNTNFQNMLRGVNIFVASHHGRTNGYCEEVFNYCSPQLVIISDKAKSHQTQEMVPTYRTHATGMIYDGSNRHVLTTRSDGNMGFKFNVTGGGEVVLGKPYRNYA